MRRVWILLPLLAGCSKPQSDQGNAPAAPAPLVDADVAGTWTGTAMPEGSDSVVMHWTQRCGAGSCMGTVEGSKDTIPSTYALSGDSAVGHSQAYLDPIVPGAKVLDSWVLRLSNGKVVGTGALRLADKPDSTVFRYHFEGSRVP